LSWAVLDLLPVFAGISYELLNAKPENVQREAEIVAQSGRKGSVTISTNMAGRGTDILLGGNPEYMARVRNNPPASVPQITHLLQLPCKVCFLGL